MVHTGYTGRLLAGAAELGCPGDVRHGHSGGVVHTASCSVLNATGYFQVTMGDILEGYIDNIRLVWLDDIVIWRLRSV